MGKVKIVELAFWLAPIVTDPTCTCYSLQKKNVTRSFEMNVITLTGYKPHEIGIFNEKHEGIIYIKKAIKKEIRKLVEDGVEWFTISGQLGTELWAAEVILQLKKEYTCLRLGVFPPYLNQEDKWKEEKQEYYREILSQADYVNCITKRPYENPGQLKLKNQFLIEKSKGLLILYDEEKKGTPIYMLEEAEKKQSRSSYHIIKITSFDIQQIVEDEQHSDPRFWTQ
jgi:uncharacterized phage-like protein YoqJ